MKAFGGLSREHRRFDAKVDQEMAARRRSLFYLERLRIVHALVTVALTVALLAWAIVLWQRGAATTGDVILVCTLGLSVLHATRDLAVALVDVTQHMARFSEALSTLLVPHQLCDRPGAPALERRGASVTFEDVDVRLSRLPDVIFEDLSFHIGTGQRVGLVGASGGGKSTLFALLQRFYDIQSGRILIDGQDVTRGHAAEPARGHRRRAAGHLAVPPLADREHPLRATRGQRRRGLAGGARGALLRLHRRAARRARHRSWAIAACACRADSASASPSRAPS